MKIFETEKVIKYIQSRNIRKQYIKSKKYLEAGNITKVGLKVRKPKIKKIYQFRITKKYRAFGVIDKNKNIIIFEISDHQQ